MAPRDVVLVRARLAALGHAVDLLAAQAEDLHALAYDKPVGDSVKVAGGNVDVDLLAIGDEQARALWRTLFAELEPVQVTVVAFAQAAGNLLSAGPSPRAIRGGSLISSADFAQAIRAQRKRKKASGEYTPHRTEDQPRYPGGKG